MHPTPRKTTVLKHFNDAQEVKDLKSGLRIDIGLLAEPKFLGDVWIFGQVVLWQDGKYAEILKTKSGKCAKPCKKCNCKDKK